MQVRGRMRATLVGGGALAMALAVGACTSSSTPPPSGGGATPGATSTGGANLSGTLNGSGSTFQLNFQQSAIQAFSSVDPNVHVVYNGVGSGTGRSNLAAGTVNFAGSDSPIPSTDLPGFKGKKVLYFPILIGPITMSYNLTGVSNLKLTPTVIAKIFQSQIKTWNDPAIKAINPGVTLPSTPISLAVRSDSSGTTQNFALFLKTAAPSVWTLGDSSTVKWPSGTHAAAGNSGVASVVKSTPGAIGYVDYSTAKSAGLTAAEIQNSSGAYVAPSAAGASASAAGVTVAPDLTFHAVWGSGASAYPITYQSWVLVYAQQPTASDANLLKAYLGYLLGDGQQLLGQLSYAPLPSSIDSQAKAQLSQITS